VQLFFFKIIFSSFQDVKWTNIPKILSDHVFRCENLGLGEAVRLLVLDYLFDDMSLALDAAESFLRPENFKISKSPVPVHTQKGRLGYQTVSKTFKGCGYENEGPVRTSFGSRGSLQRVPTCMVNCRWIVRREFEEKGRQ